MKKLTLILIFGALLSKAHAQVARYNEAISKGDEQFGKREYKNAIDFYFAAAAFMPIEKSKVQEKVNLVFDAIIALRADAEKAKKKAEDALKEVKLQKEKADKAREDAETEKKRAEDAFEEAKKQKENADKEKANAKKSYNDLQEITKTAIGASYEGGIVFMWKDTKGEKGVIAAPSDFVGGLLWQEAMDKAKEVNINGYTGWRLPTREELAMLYYSKSFINILTNPNNMPYWSSTSYDDPSIAWDRRPNGEERKDSKLQPGNVCWVRDYER
jgi:hypothetical protein